MMKFIFRLPKNFVFISSFVLAFSILSAQKSTYIFGAVQSEKGEYLNKALVFTATGNSTITNEQGYYYIDIPIQDSVSLQVKFIGYQTIDTTLYKITDTLNLNFKLIATTFELPEITIQSKQKNLFEQSDWIILDYTIWESQFFLIALKNNKRRLYHYTLEGTFVNWLEIKEKYSRLHHSCLGGLHLVGLDKAAEMKLERNELSLKPAYSKEKFEKLVAPCILQLDNQFLFKTWRDHNKRIEYFYYENQEPKLLYQIYDRIAEEVASSSFYRILGMYRQAILYPDNNSIDIGFNKEDIIAKGLWNGTLEELMITNEIHQEVGYYYSVVAKPIKSGEIISNNQLLIFDFVKEKIKAFSIIRSSKATTLAGNDTIWKDKKGHLLQDSYNEELYYLSSKNELFHLSIRKKLLNANALMNIDDNVHFLRTHRIYDDQLYFIASPTARNPQNQLYRLSINQN